MSTLGNLPEPAVLILRADLMAKAALLSVASDKMMEAFARDDTELLCAAASSIQSIGALMGEAARTYRRSAL